MIHYDVGTFHIGFIFRLRGATFLKALIFALPAAAASAHFRMSRNHEGHEFDILDIDSHLGNSQAWAALNITIGLLLATRAGQSLKRFWEGLTLVHQMSAEWYHAVSSLIAFSHGNDTEMVKEFQHTLIRLISLMHGSALHQIKETDNEDFVVLGIEDLDTDTLDFLSHCKDFSINRVEVILHWTHELITSSIGPDVVCVSPPILSRVFQELSRGLVNLNDARKITETPFPFPLAQFLVILLLAETCIIPFMVAMFMTSATWCAVLTFICILSMWSVNFIAGELEQPFGNDANDLPLSMLQENFNRSLLVLLDPRAQRAPGLKSVECLQQISAQQARASLVSPCTVRVKTPKLDDLATDVGRTIGLFEKIRQSFKRLSRQSSMKSFLKHTFSLEPTHSTTTSNSPSTTDPMIALNLVVRPKISVAHSSSIASSQILESIVSSQKIDEDYLRQVVAPTTDSPTDLGIAPNEIHKVSHEASFTVPEGTGGQHPYSTTVVRAAFSPPRTPKTPNICPPIPIESTLSETVCRHMS